MLVLQTHRPRQGSTSRPLDLSLLRVRGPESGRDTGLLKGLVYTQVERRALTPPLDLPPPPPFNLWNPGGYWGVHTGRETYPHPAPGYPLFHLWNPG